MLVRLYILSIHNMYKLQDLHSIKFTADLSHCYQRNLTPNSKRIPWHLICSRNSWNEYTRVRASIFFFCDNVCDISTTNKPYLIISYTSTQLCVWQIWPDILNQLIIIFVIIVTTYLLLTFICIYCTYTPTRTMYLFNNIKQFHSNWSNHSLITNW